jgi:radical S-adenosyl methionine domain-containing protein 2
MTATRTNLSAGGVHRRSERLEVLDPLSVSNSSAAAGLPESVNYHINKHCNFRCKGCYATFNDSPQFRAAMLPREQMFALVEAVAAAPLPHGLSRRKLTFAGGEPTLCPWLPELIGRAHEMGLITMLVTNGTRLSPDYFARLAGRLDWLTLSIDSLRPETNRRIGRATSRGEVLDAGDYAARLLSARQLAMRTKINTVISAWNWQEDFAEFLLEVRPERWKVLQVTRVAGQNDEHFDAMSVTRDQFVSFVARHQAAAAGIVVVPESSTAIRGSYVMIDPQGRFFDSTQGRHTYSQPILDVGVARAFAQVTFDRCKFEQRGGQYDFAPVPPDLAPARMDRAALLHRAIEPPDQPLSIRR